MEDVKPFPSQRMIKFGRHLAAMTSLRRTYDVHHCFHVHDIDESQNLGINSRTMVERLCCTGRDRPLNPGNISSNLRQFMAIQDILESYSGI